MADQLFTDDEQDLLAETVNIAMGKAGAALAEAFAGFVNLHVPEIRTIRASAIDETRERLMRTYERFSILHQEFFGELSGHIAVIYGPASYEALRKVLGFDDRDGDGRRQREELLLELGNALNSSCIIGIGRQLELRTGLRAPRIQALDIPASEAAHRLFGQLPTWRGETLQIDMVFHLEDHVVPFELIVTMLPDCLPQVRQALAQRL